MTSKTGDEEARASDAQRSRCISVRVRGALYGLSMDDVREVIGVRPLTRVFHAPASMSGVMSLRGEIVPVVDLAVVLGAPSPTTNTDTTRIIVVREPAGAKRRAGLLVDGLGMIREIPDAGLAPLPTTIVEPIRDYLVGVIPDPPPCTMVDVSGVLDSESLRALASPDGDI